MTSLKEYAASRKISYEAVRKQVNKYQKQLNGHIFIENKAKHLDEFAVDFLDKKRVKHTSILVQDITNEKIEELKAINSNLNIKLNVVYEELNKAKDLISEQDKLLMQSQAEKLLLEQKQTDLNQEKAKLESDLNQAAAEIEELKRQNEILAANQKKPWRWPWQKK